jgi:hypothetical protein
MRFGRSGLMIGDDSGLPGAALDSQCQASMKLIRSTATPCRRAASNMTTRTRLDTNAKHRQLLQHPYCPGHGMLH